ncbi:MAG: MerR family DNA-binding transcriptional regulator [Promethearchaeota archaeon]
MLSTTKNTQNFRSVLNSSRYLSIGIASHLLEVCPKTLRRWDRAGKLRPAFRTLGNHRQYDRQLVLS